MHTCAFTIHKLDDDKNAHPNSKCKWDTILNAFALFHSISKWFLSPKKTVHFSERSTISPTIMRCTRKRRKWNEWMRKKWKIIICIMSRTRSRRCRRRCIDGATPPVPWYAQRFASRNRAETVNFFWFQFHFRSLHLQLVHWHCDARFHFSFFLSFFHLHSFIICFLCVIQCVRRNDSCDQSMRVHTIIIYLCNKRMH